MAKKLSMNEWIDREGRKEVARLLKVDASAVGHWRRGYAHPAFKHLARAVQITRGRVSVDRTIAEHLNTKGVGK